MLFVNFISKLDSFQLSHNPRKLLLWLRLSLVLVVGVVVVHVVAVVIPVVDTRNIHNKVWLKPGY